MEQRIDARKKACPMPVMLTKKALDEGCENLYVVVDNETAKNNLMRLGQSCQCAMEAKEENGEFTVHFMKNAEASTPAESVCAAIQPAAAGWAQTAVFIGHEGIGEENELGKNLMKMFLYTLAQGDAPGWILFMNGGVHIPTGEGQMIESLHALADKGCEILVCGTCLSFYEKSDMLKVGTVSNMYEIVSRMGNAQKVLFF